MRGVMTAHHLEGVQTDTNGFAPSACPSVWDFPYGAKNTFSLPIENSSYTSV